MEGSHLKFSPERLRLLEKIEKILERRIGVKESENSWKVEF